MRCYSVRFKSTPAVSLRWSNVCSFAANQLPLPPIKVVRLGIGHAFRMPTPFGLSRLDGMMLPGKHPLWSATVQGFADCGSFMSTGILLPEASLRVTKRLLGSSNSLKSPARILTVGTDSKPADPTEEPDSRKWYLTHSSPQ